jgi:hypothetical protein
MARPPATTKAPSPRWWAAAFASLAMGCAPPGGPGFGPVGEDVKDDIPWPSDDPIDWLHDYWTPTAEACELSDPFEAGWHVPYYEDPCQEALAADLKIDVENLSGQNGGSGAWYDLTSSAFYLLGRDIGDVADLRQLENEDDRYLIREPFIEQMELIAEAMDEEQLRPVLYNLVMSTIENTIYDPGQEGWVSYQADQRLLVWNIVPSYIHGSLVMVHMATFSWQDVGHVTCPEGTVFNGSDYSGLVACDPDWAGTWGFTAAAARLQYNSATELYSNTSYHVLTPEFYVEWATTLIIEE